ncbi:hypothetical protein J2127_000572 [Methanococcus voltae]|uniref:hypothetical protein n=1 Tax=Methanococcus voltae TaxID=2188 RepID=UPI001AE1989B|nr:hypothetical protein [Methanococcus voltae]MBP2143417.1 hypothetical protein [Methanococcus voltae]
MPKMSFYMTDDNEKEHFKKLARNMGFSSISTYAKFAMEFTSKQYPHYMDLLALMNRVDYKLDLIKVENPNKQNINPYYNQNQINGERGRERDREQRSPSYKYEDIDNVLPENQEDVNKITDLINNSISGSNVLKLKSNLLKLLNTEPDKWWSFKNILEYLNIDNNLKQKEFRILLERDREFNALVERSIGQDRNTYFKLRDEMIPLNEEYEIIAIN